MKRDDTLFCALCEQKVQRGGHWCVTETEARLPEEHLAQCPLCYTFHEPHCRNEPGDWLDK